MRNNAGGAATNAGVDFQQRISAYFIVSMLIDSKISDLLSVDDKTYIKEISFETADKIDDLKILCNDGTKIFIQAKKNIDLSTQEGSELYKTLSQFINQNNIYSKKREQYILITSPKASSKINRDLKKILDSIRLNPENYEQNPLNDVERDVYKKYKENLFTIYSHINGRDLSIEEFVKFSQKVFILVMDIEESMTLETNVIDNLRFNCSVDPKLLWSSIIRSSLYYATNRLSVSRSGIMGIYGKFLKDANDHKNDKHLEFTIDGPLKPYIETFDPKSGKEVLIVEEQVGKNKNLSFMAFNRFDDCGKKRLKFYKDKVVFTNGITLKVLHRCSTVQGMKRFLSANVRFFDKIDKVEIYSEPGTEYADSTEHAKLYSEMCINLLKKSKYLLKCLHCGKAISEDSAPIIETDDFNDVFIGLIHKTCLRNIDRILGLVESVLFEKYSYLRNFDYNAWISLCIKGQGLFNHINQIKINMVMHIAWNPCVEYDSNYNYCIKVLLENNMVEYAQNRGNVQRFCKMEADDQSQKFNKAYVAARDSGNPLCYTSKLRTYGDYSDLLKLKDDDEECLECKCAEVEKYTEVIGRAYSNNIEYYAPLIILIILDTEEMFSINSHVVFITDPVLVKNHIENWEKAGVKIGDYEIKIIESDMIFDNIVRKIYKKGLKAIVNPIIDKYSKFIKGLIIEDISEILENGF